MRSENMTNILGKYLFILEDFKDFQDTSAYFRTF